MRGYQGFGRSCFVMPSLANDIILQQLHLHKFKVTFSPTFMQDLCNSTGKEYRYTIRNSS
jgi:hypothetical protein